MTKTYMYSFAGKRESLEANSMDLERFNEDSVFICQSYGFVLDGATGLLKERVTDEQSDAGWFSQSFKEYLQAKLNNGKNLTDIMRQGIIDIDKKYMSYPGANEVKSKPSSGVAVFKICNQTLQYFILGDCSLFVIYKDGSFKHFIPEDLSKFDDYNIKRMVKIAKERKISVIDAFPMISDTLLEVRNKLNKPGGYWILADNPKAVSHAFCGELSTNDISHILAMSDGFSQIFDTLNIYTKQVFADKIIAGEDLSCMCQKIKLTQNEDKLCNKFPRFKISDDMSVVMLEL